MKCQFFLVSILASLSMSAIAQWEKVTPLELFRHDLTEVLNAQQNFARAVAETNTEFWAARESLAEARPGSASHDNAAARLRKLQLGKDVYYLSSYLQTGVDKHSQAASQLAVMFGGASIDGGIPAAALPWFEAWVKAVRASLGAKNGDILILGDADIPRLYEAIASSGSSYGKYLARLQSLLEEETKNKQNAIEREKQYAAAKLANGGVRLYESKIAPLEPVHFDPSELSPLRRKLFELRDSGQKMIHCVYGPVPGVREEPGFKNYMFWYQRVPVIDPQLAGDTHGLVRRRLHQPAQNTCPANSLEADTIWEMGREHAVIEAPPAPKPVTQSPVAAKPTSKIQPRNAAWCERTGAHIDRSYARSAATGRPVPKGLKELEDKYRNLCI